MVIIWIKHSKIGLSRIIVLLRRRHNDNNDDNDNDEHHAANDEIHAHILKPKLALNFARIAIEHFRALLQWCGPIVKLI